MTTPFMTNWPIAEVLKEIGTSYSKEGIPDAWLHEKNRVGESLLALNKKLGKRFSPATPKAVLGVGGSGIVLRMIDKKFTGMDVALKFPRPVIGKLSLISEMLEKEIAQISRLRHPGIVRIIYYDTAELPDAKPGDRNTLPFYIMEMVDGKSSKAFVQDPNTTERQFVHLLTETVKIITYLHSHSVRGIVHLDIKPDNIVINASGDPVMIDLGTCKQINDDQNKTVIACTRSYAHPKLVQRLDKDPSDENRAKGELKRSEIDPRWDLWAFGKTILVWMGLSPEDGGLQKNAIFPRLSPYCHKYLLLLSARLHEEFVPDWMAKRLGISSSFLGHFPVNNSSELLDLMGRLSGNSNPFSEIPELANGPLDTMQAAPGQHVLNSERFQDILSHRLFRRLNSITQLGLVSLVYPGAKHTRREHSLGTYANTAKFLHALYDDPVSPLFRQIINSQDCRDVLLTALLHDLGQFPLGHDMEEVDEDLFSHSELTHAMLRGKWNKKKKGSKEIVFEPLDKILAKWGSSADQILRILEAKPSNASASPKAKLLRSIISGPIDADKLDYLFRDARYLNLPYPFGTDVERLYRCLTTVVIDKIDASVKDVPAIGIYSKGRVAAEALSFSRYAMFSQAYWHHTVRAQKTMLLRSVLALVENCNSEQSLNEMLSSFYALVCDLPEIMYASPQTELFKEGGNPPQAVLPERGRGTDLAATDAAVLSWLSERLQQKQLPEQKLVEGILKRVFFKRLWVVTHDEDEKKWRDIVRTWDELKRSKRHKLAWAFEEAISKLFFSKPGGTTELSPNTAKEIIQKKTAARQPWLLLDIPGKRPGSEIGLFCVRESQGRRLRKDDRVVGDLQASEEWSRYAGNLREAAGKIRIFCDPTLVETIDATIDQAKGLDILIGVLKQLK